MSNKRQTTDIVSRLRAAVIFPNGGATLPLPETCHAAADEIERLRTAARDVLALAPYGLPEDTATLYGQEAAERLQEALERLRSAAA